MIDKDLGQGLTCFIVGPIGDRLEPAGTEGRMRYENATQMWEKVFEPACEVFGLSPIRADKIAEAGDIPEQIFTYLRDADVVVADLTGGNANVMYELGLRHTRPKVTLQIGEHEHLPFDVTTIRTIKFKRTEAGLIDARNSLVELLRSALEGSASPVTATRVWNALERLSIDELRRASALSFIPDDPADVADEEGPGHLELMAQGEEALENLAATLEEFSAQMGDLTAVTIASTPNVEAANSFAGKLTEVRKFADKLQEPALLVDSTSSEYLSAVQQVDLMMGLVFGDIRDDPDMLENEEVVDFLRIVEDMGNTVETANVQFAEAMKVVRDMRIWSTGLKSVSKSLEHSLNAMMRGNAIVVGWATTSKALLPEDGGDAAG